MHHSMGLKNISAQQSQKIWKTHRKAEVAEVDTSTAEVEENLTQETGAFKKPNFFLFSSEDLWFLTSCEKLMT